MAFNKIFGIGLSKTGTTSLYMALNQLGFRTQTYRHLENKNLRKWFFGDFNHDYLNNIDAITDLPTGSLFPSLDYRYPNSKFILTLRNKESWLKSCSEYFSQEKRNPRTMNKFYKYTQLSTYGIVSYNEPQFSYIYDTYHKNVRRYFSNRNDLLELDFFNGEGWEKICDFLNVEIPCQEFPNVKPGSYRIPIEDTIKYKFKRIRNIIGI